MENLKTVPSKKSKPACKSWKQNGNWNKCWKENISKLTQHDPELGWKKTTWNPSMHLNEKSMKPPKNWQSVSIEIIQDYQQRQNSKQCYSVGPWPNSTGKSSMTPVWWLLVMRLNLNQTAEIIIHIISHHDYPYHDYHIISHHLQNHRHCLLLKNWPLFRDNL